MNNTIEIVLVEDNKSDADLIKRAFKRNNITNKIIHLKDGQEALDYFEAERHTVEGKAASPRIILLDLKMPRLNGIQVLQELKSQEHTKKIPVIVLTSSRHDVDLDKCYRFGVNSYVVKPLGFEEFVKTVSQLGFYWTLINEQ